MNRFVFALIVCLITMLAFGMTPTQAQTSKKPTTKGVGAPKAVRDLRGADSMDELLTWLPRWDDVVEKGGDGKPNKVGGSKNEGEVDGDDGKKYEKIAQTYSLTDTPDEFVALTTSGAFWLGGLVQSNDLELGVGGMRELPIEPEKRAPFLLNIREYGLSQRIGSPSASSVDNAMEKIALKLDADIKAKKRSREIMASYSLTDSYSEAQTGMQLGLGAQFAGSSLSAKLSTNQSEMTHTITGCYIERAFTAEMDLEGRTRGPAFVNANFKSGDIRRLVEQNYIGRKNPPAFIGSVGYGRILMIRITSKRSASEIKAAMEAAFKVGKAGGNVSAAFDSVVEDKSTEIRAAAYGGDENGVIKLIESGKMIDAIRQRAPLSTMKPISYRAYAMRDKTDLASIKQTTKYTVVTYAPRKGDGSYSVKIWAEVTIGRDFGGTKGVDIFGELTVNGNSLWKWTESQTKLKSHQKLAGERVEMVPSGDSGFGGKPFMVDWVAGVTKPLYLQGRLSDDDPGAKYNDTMGIWEEYLDIPKLAKLPQPVKIPNHRKQQKRNERAELYLFIERVN